VSVVYICLIKMARRARSPQLDLTLPPARSHGGRRPGAGRKRGPHGAPGHTRRPSLSRHHPVHVTLSVRKDVGMLRRRRLLRAIVRALTEGKERFGFRLVHFSVMPDHVHLLVEACDRRGLSRGMQGLSIRIARALNRALERTGPVFSHRYHARALTTPREVRHAVAYVLNNARRHRLVLGEVPPDWTDACSSAPWFDGWRYRLRWHVGDQEPPVTPARTWMLSKGWRRWGLIDPSERPKGTRSAR
jgi:REP element-mobilizing transposase RayT